MDHFTRDQRMAALQTEIYVALPPIIRATRWNALKTLIVANKMDSYCQCGYAHRIGSIGDLAVYRLKIRSNPQEKNMLTLPSLFILDDGFFQPISQDND